MTVEHKNIAESGLHEPKGVSTATINTVYTADGTGSGAWALQKVDGLAASTEGQIPTSDGLGTIVWKDAPHGWSYHKNLAVDQIIDVTPVKLINNGGAASTQEDFLPKAIRGTGTSLWDTSLNKITPMALGDTYTLRLDLPITSKTGTPTVLTAAIDIGGGVTPTTIIVDKFNPTAKTPPYSISISTSVFIGSTFIINGGQIFLSVDAGTLTLSNPAIEIVRTSAGDF